MEHTINTFCPSCQSSKSKLLRAVQDHFLSQEIFQLVQCEQCELVFTEPRPSVDSIGSYYKSDAYVSHSSTKRGLINRIYGVVRKQALKKKVRLIQSLTKGSTLLDIGAGTGHFIAKAKTQQFQVIGIEPDSDARKVAKTENELDLLELDSLYQLTSKFHAITMWHVLEHVYYLNTDIKRVSELLNNNGVFVVAVPNYTSFDAAYYQSYWAAYDVPRHLYHFSPQSIIPLIEKHGLKFEKMLPMKYDSYYVSMLSEKYKGGSFLNAIRIGFLSNWKAKNGNYSSQIYVFRKID